MANKRKLYAVQPSQSSNTTNSSNFVINKERFPTTFSDILKDPRYPGVIGSGRFSKVCAYPDKTLFINLSSKLFSLINTQIYIGFYESYCLTPGITEEAQTVRSMYGREKDSEAPGYDQILGHREACR